MLNKYKEALIQYNMMILQNEPSENIKHQAEHIKQLEKEIENELNNFQLVKQDLAHKNNTNYYRVSYVNLKKRRPNYRYQYMEDGKMKSIVRNTIEELEEVVTAKGFAWFKLGDATN